MQRQTQNVHTPKARARVSKVNSFYKLIYQGFLIMESDYLNRCRFQQELTEKCHFKENKAFLFGRGSKDTKDSMSRVLIKPGFKKCQKGNLYDGNTIYFGNFACAFVYSKSHNLWARVVRLQKLDDILDRDVFKHFYTVNFFSPEDFEKYLPPLQFRNTSNLLKENDDLKQEKLELLYQLRKLQLENSRLQKLSRQNRQRQLYLTQ